MSADAGVTLRRHGDLVEDLIGTIWPQRNEVLPRPSSLQRRQAERFCAAALVLLDFFTHGDLLAPAALDRYLSEQGLDRHAHLLLADIALPFALHGESAPA